MLSSLAQTSGVFRGHMMPGYRSIKSHTVAGLDEWGHEEPNLPMTARPSIDAVLSGAVPPIVVRLNKLVESATEPSGL